MGFFHAWRRRSKLLEARVFEVVIDQERDLINLLARYFTQRDIMLYCEVRRTTEAKPMQCNPNVIKCLSVGREAAELMVSFLILWSGPNWFWGVLAPLPPGLQYPEQGVPVGLEAIILHLTP